MTETVSLMQMLDARERRAARQQELLAQYGVPMICFTMNIAGPVKNSDLIRSGFRLGNRWLRQQLAREKLEILHFEQSDRVTGNEAIYVIPAEPLALKRIAVDLEDGAEIGRLFDMDILRADGQKVERGELGLPERQCLICGGPARSCARSRTHTVQELQRRTEELLRTGIDRANERKAAQLAVQSLLYEVCTTPKPGLVDRENNGSHRDMDIFTFMCSTSALWPYFAECGRIGRETSAETPEYTFTRLRRLGRLAEGEMLAATGNVNTHKGAIFSLGILCGALGRLPDTQWGNPERILHECAVMTAGLIETDFDTASATAGQRLFAAHGITGIRGQAEAGFPAVSQYGLPTLEKGLSMGKTLEEAGCAAMLAMLCVTEDTNMIARSDLQTYRRTVADLQHLLNENPFPDAQTLRDLDAEFTARNLSPGGSADLLAICYFLHFLGEAE